MPTVLTKVVYTTAATAVGAREGHVTSADGVVDLDLATPGRAGEPTANPETLFAAGYAACFQSALNNRGKAQGIDTSKSRVTAEVSLGTVEGGGFGLAVALTVEIPDVHIEKAQELTEIAHQFCPYSKATHGNIEVSVKAV